MAPRIAKPSTSVIDEAAQIIGVGQCGCRIGKLFENIGMSALYINSDEVDFRNFNATPDQVLLIEGSGTGGSPAKGEEMFNRHKKTIIDFVESNIDTSKLVWLVWGSGGGTGNSIGPLLLDYMIGKDYRSGCITTLPPKMLDILAWDNAMRTLKRIKDAHSSMCVLADNEYLSTKVGISSNWWEKVNSYIVGTVASVFDLIREGKETQSGFGSIDKGEIMRIMQYGKGMTDIRTVYLSPYEFNMEDKDLAKRLFDPALIEGYQYKNTLAYLVAVDVPTKGSYTEISKRIFDITKKVSGSAVSRLGMFRDPILTDSIRVTMVNTGLKLPKVIRSRINNLKRDEARFMEKRSREDSIQIEGFEDGIIDDDFRL